MHHDAMMRNMNMIRTTISLPADVHEELREEAFRSRKSLGKVVAERLKGSGRILSKTEDRAREDLDFFAALADKGKAGIDVVEAIRDMRDERTKRIAKAAGI